MTQTGNRYSNFLVTVNTNVRPRTYDEGVTVANALRVKLQHVLGPALKDHVVFLNGDSWNNKTIVTYKTKVTIEHGNRPRGKRIHAHAIVSIKHHSKIHLNKEKIRQEINTLPHVKNGWVHINGNMEGTGYVKEYLGKDLPSRKGRTVSRTVGKK